VLIRHFRFSTQNKVHSDSPSSNSNQLCRTLHFNGNAGGDGGWTLIKVWLPGAPMSCHGMSTSPYNLTKLQQSRCCCLWIRDDDICMGFFILCVPSGTDPTHRAQRLKFGAEVTKATGWKWRRSHRNFWWGFNFIRQSVSQAGNNLNGSSTMGKTRISAVGQQQ